MLMLKWSKLNTISIEHIANLTMNNYASFFVYKILNWFMMYDVQKLRSPWYQDFIWRFEILPEPSSLQILQLTKPTSLNAESKRAFAGTINCMRIWTARCTNIFSFQVHNSSSSERGFELLRGLVGSLIRLNTWAKHDYEHKHEQYLGLLHPCCLALKLGYFVLE